MGGAAVAHDAAADRWDTRTRTCGNWGTWSSSAWQVSFDGATWHWEYDGWFGPWRGGYASVVEELERPGEPWLAPVSEIARRHRVHMGRERVVRSSFRFDDPRADWKPESMAELVSRYRRASVGAEGEADGAVEGADDALRESGSLGDDVSYLDGFRSAWMAKGAPPRVVPYWGDLAYAAVSRPVVVEGWGTAGPVCRYRVLGTPEGAPGGEYVAGSVVIAEPYWLRGPETDGLERE